MAAPDYIRQSAASALLDQAYCGLPEEWRARMAAMPDAALVEAALADKLQDMSREIFTAEGVL